MNELMAISVLGDYVEAQQRYASEPRDGSGVRKFATRVLSTPGKRDGLYWEAGEGRSRAPSDPPSRRAARRTGRHPITATTTAS